MSGKRVPLSSNPNAVNSPYRTVAAAASKQKRSYATIQREEAYGQPPPAKKQMLEDYQTIRTPPRQQLNQNLLEGRVFTRKSNASQQSAFERKLVAVRERSQQTVTKADKTTEENLDTIRQWQKHYRKIFPTFVFYFESISEEVRIKYTKQVVALGAVSPCLKISSRRWKMLINIAARRKVLLQRRYPCGHDSIHPSSPAEYFSRNTRHILNHRLPKQPASDHKPISS